MERNHRLRQWGLGLLVLGFLAGMAVVPGAAAPQSQPSDLAGARGRDVVDIALKISVSRNVVPFGGSLREVMTVTNRGTIPVPTGQYLQLAFGQEINRPGQQHYPGKAAYAFARSRGGHCSHGTYGPTSKVQTFACDLRHLDPGERQITRIKIRKVKGPLLLDAGGFYGSSGRVYDDRRGNDAERAIIHVRRRH